MRLSHVSALLALFVFAAGCQEVQTTSPDRTPSENSNATRAEMTKEIHAEMAKAARTAEEYRNEGVKLLYNEDRSIIFKENAPQATKAFSKSLEALLAHEARNPELYDIPAVTAGMIEFRAQVYRERATSFMIQGKLDLYVKDWENTLETVEDLKSKLASALADPYIDAEWRGELEKTQARAVQLEGNANGALGLHYLMSGDKAKADAYLERALEILPPGDPARDAISDLLKKEQ